MRKIKVFTTLMGLVLLGNVYATIPDKITVIRLLQDEGPINWVPYSANSSERAALFSILAEIVRDPTNLTAAIQNRALSESGKFAKDDSGNLISDATRLYDEQISTPIRNSNDTTLRKSFIQGVETAYVPESVSYLLKAAEQDDRNELNEDSTSLAAADALRAILQNDPAGRPPLPDTDEFKFDAKLGTPLSDRQRSLEWLAMVGKALEEIDDLSRRASTKKLTVKKLSTIRESAEKFLAESKSSSTKPGQIETSNTANTTEIRDLPIDASPSPKPQNPSQAPDSRAKEDNFLFYFLIFDAVFMTALFIFLLRRKRARLSASKEKPFTKKV